MNYFFVLYLMVLGLVLPCHAMCNDSLSNFNDMLAKAGQSAQMFQLKRALQAQKKIAGIKTQTRQIKIEYCTEQTMDNLCRSVVKNSFAPPNYVHAIRWWRAYLESSLLKQAYDYLVDNVHNDAAFILCILGQAHLHAVNVRSERNYQVFATNKYCGLARLLVCLKPEQGKEHVLEKIDCWIQEAEQLSAESCAEDVKVDGNSKKEQYVPGGCSR